MRSIIRNADRAVPVIAVAAPILFFSAMTVWSITNRIGDAAGNAMTTTLDTAVQLANMFQ